MLCFREFLAAEKFRKRGGGVLKVSVKCFLILGAEQFDRGTTLLCCVSEISGNEKVFEKRVKECQKFQSNVFCLTVPKIFW